MKTSDLAVKITELAKTFPGFVRAGIGLEYEAGFWDNGFCLPEGFLRVVFTDRASYSAFDAKCRELFPAEPEVLRHTTCPQEKIIAANHAADVENGMSEADADDSDAFERRVLGMDEDNYQGGRYGAAGYSGCYD